MQIDVVLIMSLGTRWDGGFDLLLFGMFEFLFLCWQCWAVEVVLKYFWCTLSFAGSVKVSI